jgi:hypothetical protein
MQLALRIVQLSGRLLSALGLVCLLLGAYLAWQTLSFNANAATVTGRVVSYHEHQEGGQKSYRPRVRFKTPEGSIHTVAGQMAYTSQRYPLGAELPVVYQPAEPTKARIATFMDNWLGAAIAGGVGVISLLAGLLVRRSRSVAPA